MALAVVTERDQIKATIRRIETQLADGAEKIIASEKYSAMIQNSSRVSLDTERGKAEMGEEWWGDHRKVTSFDVIRTTKNA